MSEIRYSPEFWTPHLLNDEEVGEICTWLMRVQAADSTARTLAADMDCEIPPMDSLTYAAIRNVESLVRHLHAQTKQDEMTSPLPTHDIGGEG